MADGEKPVYSLKGKKVWVNGHRGMVGQALVRRLGAEDCHILKTTREELDLRRQADVELLARLRQRGVEMPDSIWNGASDYVAEQLGFEATRYVFGRPAELRRRARSDIQIKRAIDLLKQAKTPAEVFASIAKGN